jgi:hypothetical protein
MKKGKKPKKVLPRSGPLPPLLGKGGPMEDKTKRIPRKSKHKKQGETNQ